jgi:beta-galactosidase GanA
MIMEQPLYFGTQYYRPPTPAREDWDRDLAAIRALGMNLVKVWAIWGWMEPRPGHYEFDDLEQLLDLAHQHGLNVQINVAGVEMAPFWLDRICPGGRRVVNGIFMPRQNSLCCLPADFSAFCPDHPEVGRRMTEFFRATAARFTAHPALMGWDAWNELMGMGCYCAHTVAAYREWLRNKYGDELDALSHAWRRRYMAWEDIRPPEHPRCGYADMVEWKTFLADHTAAQARQRYDALRAGDPVHPVMAHTSTPSLHNGRGGLAWGDDDRKLAMLLDGWGVSWAPAETPIAPENHGTTYTLDITRGAADGPFWISELHASGPMVDGFTTRDSPPEYREQKFWIWTALAAQAKAVLFWQYRPELAGPEAPGWGIVRADGTFTERARQLGETGRILGKYNRELAAARPPRAPVAILYDPQIAMMQQAEHSPELFAASLKGYHRLLWELNVTAEFLHPRDLDRLGDFPLAIFPFPALIADADARILRRYVENGGHLWTEAFMGQFDERWEARPTVPPTELAELFGVSFGERHGAKELGMVPPEGATIKLPDAFVIEQMTPTPDAVVSAWAHAGGKSPLAVERQAGAGRTLCLGTLFGRAAGEMPDTGDAAAWFAEKIAKFGVVSPFAVSPSRSGVRCRLLQAGDATWVICANHGATVSTRIEVMLPCPGCAAGEVYGDPACHISLDGGRLTLAGDMAEHSVWVVRAAHADGKD